MSQQELSASTAGRAELWDTTRLPRDSVMTRQILRRTTCQPPRIPRYSISQLKNWDSRPDGILAENSERVAGTRVPLRCRQDQRADRRRHLTVVA
jgi:hypothetical protein